MQKRVEASGRRVGKPVGILLGIVLCGFISLSPAPAAVLDLFGPPPPGDPSAQTGPYIGLPFADNALKPCIDNVAGNPPGCTVGLLPTNAGAMILQDNVQGTHHDVGLNNSLPENERVTGGGRTYDIPTESRPSPGVTVPGNGPKFCFDNNGQLWPAGDPRGTCAQAFTQQMLLFEEFGLEPLDSGVPLPVNPFPAPAPTAYQSGPDPVELELFLAQTGIGPFPTREANTADPNPWNGSVNPPAGIQGFLGRALEQKTGSLVAGPAEGRPPGEAFAHQRWNEFYPQEFFKTALAGARVNGGFRDAKQRHGYSLGEFGPGGLYHTIYGTNDNASILVGSTAGLGIKVHPTLPLQNPLALWTFDGTLPPKLLIARSGKPQLMRNYNALPIDPKANRGFGLHTISTHEHNGHNPAESDGYAQAFFFPGQFFDYNWPLALAGYDTTNTTATEPRAAFPCTPGETLFVNDSTDNTIAPRSCIDNSIMIRGDWRETMSTKWFHDHMVDFTAQNVYKGNAAMMNIYSALDRGNEGFNDGVNLRFPSGTALPWGNRDYDINLVIADKAWDAEGQLWFNIYNKDGFLGDHVLTNWLYKPYLNVRARRYRFRILNGSVSRYFAIALVVERNDNNGELAGPNSNVSYDRVPFHMIANDGNLMEHAVPFDGSMDLDGPAGNSRVADDFKGLLPTQSIAERYDIIVDFGQAGISPGDKLYFVNTLEHRDGQQVLGQVPLADILRENYLAVVVDDGNGLPMWENDPAVGKFLEFRVQPYSGTDLSMNPALYVPGGLPMVPLSIHSQPDGDLPPGLENARHRTFEFTRGPNGESPWVVVTDNNLAEAEPAINPQLTADPRRVSAAPQLTTGPTQAGFSQDVPYEVWTIKGGQGWDHPVHVHFEEGVILSRAGQAPPVWEQWARKDMYRIGPSPYSDTPVVMAIRFREFAGTYVEHCHNTQHEDHAMLLRWDLEHPGQFLVMATPLPTWDGVEYIDSAALPTFRTVELSGTVSGLPTDNTTPGNNVTFTAKKIGVPGPGPWQYEFQRRPQGGDWATVRSYNASDNMVWTTTGAAPGAYETKVNVRQATNPNLFLGSATLPFTLTNSAVLTANPADNTASGNSVTFTGAATSGAGPFEYEFQARVAGGAWVTPAPYGPGNTWVWDTTGSPAGGYEVLVNIRTVGNVAAEASATIPYLLTSPAVTVSLAANPADNTTSGNGVTYTATPAGGAGPFEYEFQARAAGGAWVVPAPYGAGNTWVWDTTGSPAGGYEVKVNIRQAGTAGPDASATIPYVLTSPAATVSLAANPAGSTASGNGVTYTATPTSGTGPFEYEFQARVAGGAWVTPAPYGSGNTWVWDTTGSPAGGYEVQVNMRKVGDATPSATAAIPYTLTASAATVSLTADPAGNTASGNSVTYTATPTSGTGPFEYEFQARVAGGAWVTPAPYGSGNTWVWDTTGSPAGGYEVLVNMRKVGDAAPGATATIPYTLN